MLTCKYEHLEQPVKPILFCASQPSEHTKFGTKEHGMKTSALDLRVNGIIFLVRVDQTPPLLGNDTFCRKMEILFELRGRCQLSL
jgi:hypothetical protein